MLSKADLKAIADLYDAMEGRKAKASKPQASVKGEAKGDPIIAKALSAIADKGCLYRHSRKGKAVVYYSIGDKMTVLSDGRKVKISVFD